MPDVNATPPEQFLDALKRRNLEGKRALISDLRGRKTDKALEILVDLLEDESWYLRDLAVDALRESGEKAALRLHGLLESGLWYTRSAAARALGKMGHAESLGRLVDLLDEANGSVREAALASIADLVVEGQARAAAVLFWQQGRRRAEELKRTLLSAHPEAGGLVAEYLEDPSSFLEEVPSPVAEEPPAADEAPGEEARKA